MESENSEYLAIVCEICGAEMIALHGFFVVCPNCPETEEREKYER